jgi:hypothetical protein
MGIAGIDHVCYFHGLPRIACGIPSGICFYPAVGIVHQPGSTGTPLIFFV